MRGGCIAFAMDNENFESFAAELILNALIPWLIVLVTIVLFKFIMTFLCPKVLRPCTRMVHAQTSKQLTDSKYSSGQDNDSAHPHSRFHSKLQYRIYNMYNAYCWGSCSRLCLFLLTFVHPTVSTTMFKVFQCSKIINLMPYKEQYWLVADRGVECYITGGEWQWMAIVSSFTICTFVIGWPVLCLIMLMRWKSKPLYKKENDPPNTRSSGDEKVVDSNEQENIATETQVIGIERNRWSIPRSKSNRFHSNGSNDHDNSSIDKDNVSEEHLEVETKFIHADHGIHVAYDANFALKETKVEGK